MVYVDTNILIRLATNDVPTLRERAQHITSSYPPRELCIPDAVLAELFFVLHNNQLYRYDRATICEMIIQLLRYPQLFISEPAERALSIAAKHPKLDFTDCLLAAYADDQTKNLLSFDKYLLKVLS